MIRKPVSDDQQPRWRHSPSVAPAPDTGTDPDRPTTGGVAKLPSQPANQPADQQVGATVESAGGRNRTPLSDPSLDQRGREGQDVQIDLGNLDQDQDSSVASAQSTARVSSWLLSLIVHLVILIALALLTYRLGGSENGISIDGAISSDGPVARLESLQPATEPARQSDQQVSEAVEVEVTENTRLPSAAISPIVSPENPDAQTSMSLSGGAPKASQRHAYFGGGGMSARNPEGRKKYGDLFGATPESEAALENALRWLAMHQRSDGSWSFDLNLDPCDGRCGNGRPHRATEPAPATAATGLALLAFLGAGNTAEKGPYKQVVNRGLYYLKSVARESEFGYHWQQNGRMYAHGIALMALSEALGMTRHGDDYDSDLLFYVQKGALFTETAQHSGGSWGYTPGSPGDTTLTGWQILSLIGARKAGVQMRSDLFSRTREFLMSVRAENGDYEFGYRSREPEPTNTAIALTLLIYMGQGPGNTNFDRAVDRLAELGPSKSNVYHNYYATMVLHHFRHRDWEDWNARLRDHLVETQATEGHEAGSWHFKDRYGDVGGRLYTTAMCALILEVYYRFLPLYDQPPEFPL